MMTRQTLALIRALMSHASEWTYGYDLSRESGLKSGTLYPMLIRFAGRGWLESEWRHEEGEKPRHMYRLTAHGRSGARLAISEAKVVAGRLKAVRSET
jgi:PadR family transcriptional regulator, regulatory protein PadR